MKTPIESSDQAQRVENRAEYVRALLTSQFPTLFCGQLISNAGTWMQ